jgi:hypothetical protein
MKFKQLDFSEDIKDIIQNIFDTTLDISGGFGYTQEEPTKIYSTQRLLKEQLQLTLCAMRANLEMNITLDKDKRYSGINPSEIAREKVIIKEKILDKITYKVTATKEDMYNSFIKEYKENHQNPTFDLTKHFDKRKENEIYINEIYWFEIY